MTPDTTEQTHKRVQTIVDQEDDSDGFYFLVSGSMIRQRC